MSLDTYQLAFVIVAPLVVLLLVFAFLFTPIKRKIVKRRFKNFYAKKVYKTALYKDFYLINEFTFKFDESYATNVDHILFGEKYIYLISDYYYEGALQGKNNDTSLISISKKGKKVYVDNPINSSKKLLERFSSSTRIDQSLLIGIVLINGDCLVDVEQKSGQFYIIQYSHFDNLIKAIENRDVSYIKSDELAKLVKDLYKLKKKRKRNETKRN